MDHRGLLQERLRAVKVPLSEYSFANIYLFRHAHAYEVLPEDGVFIRGRSYEGSPFVMPTVDIRALDTSHLRSIMGEADFLFPIPEEWLEGLESNVFEHTYTEGDSDYLFRTDKMASFSGRKLHKKRNLMRQFQRSYSHEARPLTQDRLGDARAVLDQWQRDTGEGPEQTDYGPCQEALDLYEELVLCGAIYYVDDEPAGFIVGEELNEETFSLHFAKARKEFKGIYEQMYNTFANVLPRRYRYMNFEQDLGKAALRIAKSSYDPDILLKKYRVALRADA